MHAAVEVRQARSIDTRSKVQDIGGLEVEEGEDNLWKMDEDEESSPTRAQTAATGIPTDFPPDHDVLLGPISTLELRPRPSLEIRNASKSAQRAPIVPELPVHPAAAQHTPGRQAPGPIPQVDSTLGSCAPTTSAPCPTQSILVSPVPIAVTQVPPPAVPTSASAIQVPARCAADIGGPTSPISNAWARMQLSEVRPTPVQTPADDSDIQIDPELLLANAVQLPSTYADTYLAGFTYGNPTQAHPSNPSSPAAPFAELGQDSAADLAASDYIIPGVAAGFGNSPTSPEAQPPVAASAPEPSKKQKGQRKAKKGKGKENTTQQDINDERRPVRSCRAPKASDTTDTTTAKAGSKRGRTEDFGKETNVAKKRKWKG